MSSRWFSLRIISVAFCTIYIYIYIYILFIFIWGFGLGSIYVQIWWHCLVWSFKIFTDIFVCFFILMQHHALWFVSYIDRFTPFRILLGPQPVQQHLYILLQSMLCRYVLIKDNWQSTIAIPYHLVCLNHCFLKQKNQHLDDHFSNSLLVYA